MQIRRVLLASAATCAVLALPAAPASAQVLTGQVASAEEGNMEGVVVSAKKAGSTITISVISDDKGKFTFPASKLEPGQYNLRIRAIGYELDGPKTVEVGAQTAPVSIKLKKTRNLAAQLTSAEWFMSFPGTPRSRSSLHGPLHELPHLRADREVELRRRWIHRGAAAHGQLRPRHHAVRTAEAQGNAAPR